MLLDDCSLCSLAPSEEDDGFVVIADAFQDALSEDMAGLTQEAEPEEVFQDSRMSSFQDDMIESRQDLEALDEEEDERNVSHATTHRRLQQVAQDLSKVVQIVTS